MIERTALSRSSLAVAVAVAVAQAFFCLFLLSPPTASAAEHGTADSRAEALADQVMTALGGMEAWDAARLVEFGFAGRRQHAWDRHRGLSRVEGTEEDGTKWVAIQDLGSREGRAWVDGEEVRGERAAELLERGYGAWVNDTYWLVMPYKLGDPGVALTYEGEREIEGERREVLGLAFEGVGLTPGDRYWVYVDPDSGLVTHWAYRLEDMERDAEPVAWRWEGWREVGGVMLSPRRVRVSDDRLLELWPLAVRRDVPEGLFDGP